MPDMGDVISEVQKFADDASAESFEKGRLEGIEEGDTERDRLNGEVWLRDRRIAALEAARPAMLVGAAVGGNSDPAPLEAALGRPLDLRRTYYGGSDAEVTRAVTRATTDLAAGRIPFISFKAPQPWPDMALGKGNSWAVDIAQRLDQLGGEVWVVVHHEPEGDQPDIADWSGMQRQVAPIFDRGRVKFGIALTGYPQVRPAATKGKYALDVIYPRGVPIKFLAVDLYQRYGTTDAGLKWTPLDEFFGLVAAFAAQVGVPWGLAETGVTEIGFNADPDAYKDLFAAARRHGAAFLCLFNTHIESNGEWSVTPQPAWKSRDGRKSWPAYPGNEAKLAAVVAAANAGRPAPPV